jgi:nuclear pore complex protein Nup155
MRLLTHAVEAISFILLLFDYNLPDIIGSCSQEQRESLLSLTYQDLLTTKKGRDIAKSLVNALINHQIGQNQSVRFLKDVFIFFGS